MQGSLDQPPIIIRSSQKYSALLLLIAIVFVASFVFMLRDPTINRGTAYFGLVFFGLGIPLFAWRLIRPDVMTLAPDGITRRSTFRAIHWTWGDVQAFRAYKPTSKNVSKHLGFDFTDSYYAKGGRDLRAVKAITGVEGSLGGGWEMNATDLADLLNTARARWANVRS